MAKRGKVQTAAEAFDLLRKVVDEAGGDYIDPRSKDNRTRCLYVVDGAPACIIARALHLAGWSISELAALDDHADGNGMSADMFDQYFPLEITPQARSVFETAQSEQDRGRPWRVALEVTQAFVLGV
jgi:hypothetical protein